MPEQEHLGGVYRIGEEIVCHRARGVHGQQNVARQNATFYYLIIREIRDYALPVFGIGQAGELSTFLFESEGLTRAHNYSEYND